MDSSPTDRERRALLAPAPHPFFPWLVVAAGGLMGCVAVGAVFALAVFLQPMSVEAV